jgi:4-diphosphocytidyl-2-C-methyl-D-erythritol kinase
MTRRVRLRSFAKINLDLRILNKRSDGFHELRSIFQTISLSDLLEIDFESARRTELLLADPLQIPDNLILRAARAALDALRVKARIQFRLTKNIPMGGGLGGGSSNAAAVLLALPVLAGRPLSIEKLTEIGARLGSDVPFFLTGGAAMGFGRGEELYPLPDLAEEPILVALPGVHVATGPAYAALGRQLTFIDSSRSISGFQAYVRALSVGRSAVAACGLGANDFEPVVFGQFPKIKTIAGKLRKSGARGVRMTGSGSAVIAMFASQADRDRAQTTLAGGGSGGVLAASLLSRRSYQRAWRNALRDHVAPASKLWPPQSRYAR